MKFSQNNEEQIILEYFKGFTGTVLDIGANDGITFSNSRALILQGWCGLLVDASPLAYARLQKLYSTNPHVQTLNCAVGSEDTDIVFHESGSLITTEDVALVSTSKQSEKNRWGNSVVFNEIEVPCLTFKYLMKLSRFKTFDFVTIDIEGMELEVLPQMDFEKLQTKMVCVEWNGKNEKKFVEILSGFNLIHKNAENLIFVK